VCASLVRGGLPRADNEVVRDIREFGIEPDPVIEAYKKHVDRTLLRENLKLTVEERLEALRQMQLFYDEAQAARKAEKHGYR
jgi:hypothetical protein